MSNLAKKIVTCRHKLPKMDFVFVCASICTIQSSTFMKRTVGTPPNGRPWRTLLRECAWKHLSAVPFSSLRDSRKPKASNSTGSASMGGALISNGSNCSIRTAPYLTDETKQHKIDTCPLIYLALMPIFKSQSRFSYSYKQGSNIKYIFVLRKLQNN